jgi:hypothetical protein
MPDRPDHCRVFSGVVLIAAIESWNLPASETISKVRPFGCQWALTIIEAVVRIDISAHQVRLLGA